MKRVSLALGALLLGACALTPNRQGGGRGGGGTDAPGDTGTTVEPNVPPELEALTEHGGCADITMYAHSESEAGTGATLALWFGVSSTLTVDAFESGTTQSATYDLATEGTLELWRGAMLENLLCNDFLTGDEVQEVVWRAVSGTVELSVTSTADVCEPYDCPAEANITLRDARLESTDAEPVEIGALGWRATVGWLPG